MYLDLPKPFMILAPMDDVTDSVFRRVVIKAQAPDLCFTEFVNVDGLQSPGRQKLLKKLYFTPEEQPLIAQVWGKDPDNFYKTSKEIVGGTIAKEMGLPRGVNFAGVDLNMGCPQKTEVSSGTCAALMNDRPLAHEIIEATKKGLGGELLLSVKTRIGFNTVDLSWIEFLLKHQLSMLTLHGRTRKEKSAVLADWEVIGEARKLRDKISPDTLIVGNGDVRDKQHGLELAARYNLDGIMIGRGIFSDLYAFADNSPWQELEFEKRIELFKTHVELFASTWQNNERPIHTLNKFCKIYISNFEGAKELREKFMSAKSAQELIKIIDFALEGQIA